MLLKFCGRCTLLSDDWPELGARTDKKKKPTYILAMCVRAWQCSMLDVSQ